MHSKFCQHDRFNKRFMIFIGGISACKYFNENVSLKLMLNLIYCSTRFKILTKGLVGEAILCC